MKNLILLSILAALLQSCSGSGGGSGNGITNQPITDVGSSTYSKLTDGIYNETVQVCKQQDSQYYHLSYVILSGEFTEMRIYFSDSNCSVPFAIGSTIFNFYSYTTQSGVVGQITTFKLIDAQLVIQDSGLLTAYNAISAYGYNDWNSSNSKVIIDRAFQPNQAPRFVSNSPRDMLLYIDTNNRIFINGVEFSKQ